MLSQLSNHIKLCNPVCHSCAFDNSSLCGVSRKWDLLRVPQCAPSIWNQMPSEPSEVCDLGRTRISFHESNSCLHSPLWVLAGMCSTAGAKSVLFLQMGGWIVDQRRAIGHVHRQSWAAEFSRAELLSWMGKEGIHWLLVKDGRKYIDLGGRRWGGEKRVSGIHRGKNSSPL